MPTKNITFHPCRTGGGPEGAAAAQDGAVRPIASAKGTVSI